MAFGRASRLIFRPYVGHKKRTFSPYTAKFGEFYLGRLRILAKKTGFWDCWVEVVQDNRNYTFIKQTLLVLGQVEVADYEKIILKHNFAF